MKKLKQNNSFELKKIKVYLPKEILEKNKNKKFKYLELFLDLPEDPWREACFKPTCGRVILITRTDEGYSYKPINFSMSDISDEEFDEFLKIFNIQGSCTSKISL